MFEKKEPINPKQPFNTTGAPVEDHLVSQVLGKSEKGKIVNRARKHLRRDVWNAMEKYQLIEDGDRVMVCLSGGKDSYTMLDILLHFQKESDIKFGIVAINLDQKQPGFPE